MDVTTKESSSHHRKRCSRERRYFGPLTVMAYDGRSRIKDMTDEQIKALFKIKEAVPYKLTLWPEK